MFGIVLLFLFLVVPVAELYVIIQVGSAIGVLDTIGLLILISVVGAWLVRREGLGVLSRVQTQLAAGQLPTKELVDGLLILVAGALMLTPGFLTDAVGVLLLLPPTRAVVRTVLIHRFRDRVQVSTPFGDFGADGFGPSGPGPGGPAGPRGSRRGGPVWDVNEVTDLGDVPHTPVEPDELEP